MGSICVHTLSAFVASTYICAASVITRYIQQRPMSPELILGIVAIITSVVALLASVVQFLISRWDLLAGAAEQRLQALEKSYAEVAQPAMAQLDAIKMMYPGDALWTALQFRPPAGPNMTPVEEQQLRAAQMDLLLAEQRARNAIKGFWDDTLRAMQQGKLPPAFGRASGNHVRFASSRWVYRANNFRELAEPFDIANYYRLELDRFSGHYLEGDNRPSTYERLESMWRQHCGGRLPRPATMVSSVAWAAAAAPLRIAPQPAAMPHTAVQRLPPLDLPPGTSPLVHHAL